jgi:hypothetical protein
MQNMKKTLYTIAIIALVVISIVIATSRKNSTIQKDLRDFNVEDTSIVDKIFIANKAGRHVLLEKTNGVWMVDGNDYARESLVELVLEAMHRMRVKEPVAQAAKENVIKSIAAKGIKVEIYSKDKNIKTFYVGGPTQDSYGTFMILEGSASPFIVEVPGFRGYLTVRFIPKKHYWLSNYVSRMAPGSLKEIILDNHKKPATSYHIKKDAKVISLMPLGSNVPVSSFDTIAVKSAIGRGIKLAYSKIVEDVPQYAQDSILKSQPMFDLFIIDNNNDTTHLKGFTKPAWGKLDAFGEPLDADPDHFFLALENGTLTYAQYFAFGSLLTSFDDLVNK